MESPRPIGGEAWAENRPVFPAEWARRKGRRGIGTREVIERAERRADVATLPRTCVEQGSLKRSIKYRVELSVGGFLLQWRGRGGRKGGWRGGGGSMRLPGHRGSFIVWLFVASVSTDTNLSPQIQIYFQSRWMLAGAGALVLCQGFTSVEINSVGSLKSKAVFGAVVSVNKIHFSMNEDVCLFKVVFKRFFFFLICCYMFTFFPCEFFFDISAASVHANTMTHEQLYGLNNYWSTIAVATGI